MNEYSKLLCAAALVALGLGLAFLCGPPADLPEILSDSPQLQARVGPAVAQSNQSPLRLQVDRTANRDAFDSAANGIVLSAGVMEPVPNSTTLKLREPERAIENNQWVPLPLPAELDENAVPLASASKTTTADSRDDWLLKPPNMPRTYGSKATTAAGSPSFVSSAASPPTEESPWWTQDTPRLQGLNGSPTSPASSAPANTPPGKMVFVQPSPPMNTTVAPIPLESGSVTAIAASKAASPAVRLPVESYRTHLVADGDTLTRLAERYLKDAGRAREILELNRDVLTSPELLPIGAALRIPHTAAQEDLQEEYSAGGSRMVPVTPWPETVEGQPRAQLQVPSPVAANGW